MKYGTWNTKQLAMDFGGPLTEDGNVGYRLTGLARDADTMVRHINNDRQSLSGTARMAAERRHAADAAGRLEPHRQSLRRGQAA
ncbi:hypothetical protein WJ972_10260 [Achromobacter insuavis]